jgi:hypothetical protein
VAEKKSTVAYGAIFLATPFDKLTFFFRSLLTILLIIRSPKLKRLCLVSCYSVYKEAFIEFIAKCPLIEDIALINCGSVVFHALNVITGKSFPQLKRFELRTAFERPCYGFDVPLGIPTVRHLQHLILGGIIDIDNEEPPALTLILLASGSAMSSRSSMLRTLRAKCAKIKIRTEASLLP